MRPFEFRWKNFRCFKDTKWREIKPLTIVIGKNNSGKTSLIAPILLLKQSLKSFDIANPLMMKGEFNDFGSYNQFVINHDLTCDVEFGFRFPYKKKDKTNKKLKESEMRKLNLVFEKGTERKSARLKKFELTHESGITIIRKLMKGKPKYSLNISSKSKKEKSKKILFHDEDIKNILFSHQPDRFLFYSGPIISDLIKYITKNQKEFNIRFSEELSSYIRPIDEVSFEIQDLLERTDYLGPIRNPPERTYQLSGDLPFSVGATGGLAPEILFRYRNKTLKRDVNIWLQKFDENVLVESKGSHTEGTYKINFVNLIKPEKKEYKRKAIDVNFADSGFGFSQLLPIIVQGLHITKGDLLIFEQPEIHLNPKYQSKLADFFAYLISKGYKKNKYILVETHSEHLLLRIRTLIAKGDINSSDVALYYVEKKEKNSEIVKIPIDKNGYIPDEKWPENFFDESLEEALNLSWYQQQKNLKRNRKED